MSERSLTSISAVMVIKNKWDIRRLSANRKEITFSSFLCHMKKKDKKT